MESKNGLPCVDAGLIGEVLEPEGKLWRVVREPEAQNGVNTEDHWLELADAEFDRENVWPKWTASVKWDGCVHLHETWPDEMKEQGQYWHLCDGIDGIDAMIDRLQHLKAAAIAHYRNHDYRDEARWNPEANRKDEQSVCVFPLYEGGRSCGMAEDAPIHHEPGIMRHDFTLRNEHFQ